MRHTDVQDLPSVSRPSLVLSRLVFLASQRLPTHWSWPHKLSRRETIHEVLVWQSHTFFPYTLCSLRLYARVFLQHQREHAAYACRLVVKYSIFTCSSDNLLALALIVRVHSICRASKCLLNGWSWFRRDIEFRKFGSHLEDIHSCGIENLFGRGYCYSQVRVLSKSRDEKHEATSLDLHFGEVCAAGGDIGMPPVKGVSRKFVTDFMGYKRVCCTYAMLCL
jgi:hypothetical protein